MKLYVTEVEAKYEVSEPWRSPGFGGSVLHGALGRALRRAGCVAEGGRCAETCTEPERCGFSQLFESAAVRQTGHTSPFVPLFPADKHLDVTPERPLRLGALVLGAQPDALLDTLVRGLEALEDEVLVDDGPRVRLLTSSILGRRARAVDVSAGERGPGVLTIDTHTPLILEEKDEGGRKRLVERPSFAQLFEFVQRRVVALCEGWGEVETEAAAAMDALRADAARVETVPATRLERKAWSRYGDGRPKDFDLRGIHGTAVYAGPVGAFVPLFAAAALVGVGKSTAFGLGRFDVALTAVN